MDAERHTVPLSLVLHRTALRREAAARQRAHQEQRRLWILQPDPDDAPGPPESVEPVPVDQRLEDRLVEAALRVRAEEAIAALPRDVLDATAHRLRARMGWRRRLRRFAQRHAALLGLIGALAAVGVALWWAGVVP